MQITNYENNYFDADVLVMELNSRGFEWTRSTKMQKLSQNDCFLAQKPVECRRLSLRRSCTQSIMVPRELQMMHERHRCLWITTTKSPNLTSGRAFNHLSLVSVEAAKTWHNPMLQRHDVGSVVTLLAPYNWMRKKAYHRVNVHESSYWVLLGL